MILRVWHSFLGKISKGYDSSFVPSVVSMFYSQCQKQNWLTAAYQHKKRMPALQRLKNKLKINIEKEKDVSWIGSCKSQS